MERNNERGITISLFFRFTFYNPLNIIGFESVGTLVRGHLRPSMFGAKHRIHRDSDFLCFDVVIIPDCYSRGAVGYKTRFFRKTNGVNNILI